MSFFTALSGLNAAQQDISSTSNNIANVSTLGFHGSRPEFVDIFFSSPQSQPARQVGSGVNISRMTRDFSSGATISTGNVFDLSLSGQGFFLTQIGNEEGAEIGYTRAGAFNMLADGTVSNASGNLLHAFPTAANGEPLSTRITQPLQIPQTFGVPEATTALDVAVQVSLTDNGGFGTQAGLPAAVFDPDNSATYAFSTEVPVLDAEGAAVPAQAFLVLETAPTPGDPSIAYSIQLVRDGEVLAPSAPAEELSFDATGLQTGAITPQVFTDAGGGTLSISFANSVVSRDDFAVLDIGGDGAREQRLSSIDVTDDGTVFANYGGEASLAVGKIAVATFTNLQALSSIGSSTYLATQDAGEVRLGIPGSTGFGGIESGSVEQSNVDLTEELVHLIMAQRNYQASAKALETNGTLAETVMNIRT
ncbi:MAG: flagellar hook protein FlgE [Pseudomonadota bacterium]